MAKPDLADGVDPGFQFDAVRQMLLQDQFKDRLDKPLQYWVLPSDRRLPLALLGRTIGELLSTPFEDLSATPGIGHKKICSLVKLLDRATRDEPPSVSLGEAPSISVDDDVPSSSSDVTERRRFDPGLVSEALWSEWREAVRLRSIEDQKLGRLAPSLQRLPTVIWHTPLRDYLDHTVAEIRALRTHGEKRVRCVLEVFHSVYHRLSNMQPGADLPTLLTPPWVIELSSWARQRRHSPQMPSESDVAEGFVRPLVDLVETDCGPTVLKLVKQRLGIGHPPQSVREQARTLQVTRARIYQLLDDVAKVMAVRWPEGRIEMDQLAQHFSTIEAEHGSLRLFFGFRELCFPEKHESITFRMGKAFAGDTRESTSQSHADTQPHAETVRVDPRVGKAVERSGDGVEDVSLRSDEPGVKVTRTDGSEANVPQRHGYTVGQTLRD